MTDIEEILQRYRQADQQQRLALFMSYRELREEFQELDRAEPDACGCAEPLPARLPRSWSLTCWRTRLTITLDGR